MGLGQRLELRQTAQLVMTPQLQQAIRLLQMTNVELHAFVAEEVERNPLLDLDGGAEAAAPKPEPEVRLEDQLRDATPGAAEADLDAGREALYDEAVADIQAAWTASGAGSGQGPGGADIGDFADSLGDERSLRDHLGDQIGLMQAPPHLRAIALHLVDEIDEAGYLRLTTGDTCARLGVDAEAVEAAVALIHACEPTGIGARSLSECLALQLREKNRLDPAIRAVLDNLDLLAEGRFDRLMTLAGVGREDMAEIIAEIRALDPRPGHAFGSAPAQTAVADVFVRKDASGLRLVELNTDTLPRVLMNNAYAARIAAGGGAARTYVSECRGSATWLAKTLEQRARTILKVATEIVRRQEDFFETGVSALRPLTLREVAEAVGMHESTVSRVTAGKYLSCARGLYELRYFFSQSLAATDGGDALSATAIRDRIRRLIESEDPKKVLSDDTIVEILVKDGVDIARRTVAKYREGMNIPSSIQRRRLKSGLSG